MSRRSVRLLFVALCSVLFFWSHAQAIDAEWKPISPKPLARSSLALAFDAARGRLVLFGGYGGGPYLADTWEWDGDTWTQRTPTISPPARIAHALTYDSKRRRVVLFGGFGGNGNGYSRLADTWEWDGDTWTQRTPAISPSARTDHALAYDSARERVVLFGGSDGGPYLADTWEWDGDTWTQRTPTISPPARIAHALTYDSKRGRVVLFGGMGGISNGYSPLADTWEWDGTTWTQRTPTISPPARSCHALAYDSARERVVLFGGDGGIPSLADTWEWDGDTWTQRTPTISPPARRFHALAYDSTLGRVVLFGGEGVSGFTLLADTWVWDGTDWTQRTPDISPPGRVAHALAYDAARERVVLYGGCGSSVCFVDTWEWDGTNWTQRFPATSPPARSFPALAYDAARERVILFGGLGSGYLADTWEWDGTNWTQRFPATSPPGRIGHVLAYDSARERVILFGGQSAAGVRLADTWEWDGINWTQRFPATSPPGRVAHALAYDAARKRVALFGGKSAADVQLADTWEWDGTNWTQRFPATSPPARASHALAYDTARERVILFGGEGDFFFLVRLADTWEWDGTNWTQRFPATSPPARYIHALAYDAARERVILFGGNSAPGLHLADTWEYGPLPETLCDGVDDNGNGVIDEGCDDDHDGYCDTSMITVGTPAVCPHGQDDCDDSNPGIHPGAVDLPGDPIDQDCDGTASCDSSAAYGNHGEFVTCVSRAAAMLMNTGRITPVQLQAIIDAASHSSVGKK